MGLIVYIYKNQEQIGDCSNGGITSQQNRLCLTNVKGPFSPDEDTPAAVLQPGHGKGTAVIVPSHLIGKSRMFGGAYAATCDSRLAHAYEKITGHYFYGAIPIHDREE